LPVQLAARPETLHSLKKIEQMASDVCSVFRTSHAIGVAGFRMVINPLEGI
jgi:hypothetical protein